MYTPTLPAIEQGERGLVVSSQVVAEGAGVQHKNVLELIGTHQAQIERFGAIAFETRLPRNGGHPVRIALLGEQQATLVMSFMRNTPQVIEFKVSLVKGFYDMAQQIQQQQGRSPAELSRKEILTMALEAEERAEGYKAELEMAAPKITYVDRFVADGDSLRFSTVASTLEIKESQLRALLIAAEWIYREATERWSEKQQKKVAQYRYSERASHKSYFNRVVVHDAPRFRGEVDHTLKITPPGAQAIGRLMDRVMTKYEDLDSAIEAMESERLRRRGLKAVS